MKEKAKVIVIGAGVVGSLAAREFSFYNCDVTLIDMEEDFGWGVSKANSAVIHGGYDDTPGSMRARLCGKGNSLYSDLQKELGIDLKRIGSYVLAFNDEDLIHLKKLLIQAEENKIPDCEIHSKEKILEKEPDINPAVLAGFWCPSAGITDPWMVAIAAAENGIQNGMEVRLSEKVTGFEISESENGRCVKKVKTQKAEYFCDIVVNAGGLYADKIAELAGAECTPLHPRKGEYILLDKKMGEYLNTILFPVPNAISKGILVLPTVDGGLLLGPTAEDLSEDETENTSTTKAGLQEIMDKTKEILPIIDWDLTVKTFAGLRPESAQKDFSIGETSVKGFFNAGAMRSPGLTAAPAIAKYLIEEIIKGKCGYKLDKKEDFDPFLKPYLHVSDLSLKEWESLIRKDEKYGNLVCICNKVTEAEVINAIKRGARTIDGIKFRTRAGFGRCQSGFCLTKIAEILSRELNIPLKDIKMRSGNTKLLSGKVRS